MTLQDAQQILNKAVEIEGAIKVPDWMKIKISVSVPRDAAQMVYNELVKPFGSDKQFAAGEIVYYKGVRLILQP